MTEGISPSFGVPRDEPKENSYGEIVESKTNELETIDKENQYSTGATPSFGVERKSIFSEDEEPILNLHTNTSIRKNPNIPKTWTGKSYDELNPEGLGAWVYGFNASQEGAYELLNNIPGSVDRFFDFVGEQTGLDTNDEGFFEEGLQNLEYWLTKKARLTNPEYLGLEAPETLRGKFMAGGASAPITVASYIPATMALGPVGGFALTDAIRAAEPDAGLMDIATGAAWGAVFGKTLKWANNYSMAPRIAIMGGMGFGSSYIQTVGLEPPSHYTEEQKREFKNQLSLDRYASALVMMGLGIPGRYKTGMPWWEGIKKETPWMKTKVELNKEQVNKDLEKIYDTLKKGEYDVTDPYIKSIIEKRETLELTDLELIQNVKNYAENIKEVDKFVKDDVAKKDFSVGKFEAAVIRIAKNQGLLEAKDYYTKFTQRKIDFETKPLNKILKVNEKLLNERIKKKQDNLEVKEVEPKTITFNKDESIYSSIDTALFKETESNILTNSADVVLPIIKALPKYQTYLKNLKKSLTDTFGKTFSVYRLMDRNDFKKLAYSSKGIDKPLSVSLDYTITNKSSWVMGKTKLERETQAQNESIIFPGSLKINDPVLVRMEIDAKSVLFKGDKNLSEIIIDGTKVNTKNVELIKDNKGLAKKKLTEDSRVQLETYQLDLEGLLTNKDVNALMQYRSIEPMLENIYKEIGIWKAVIKNEKPKSEIDAKTGAVKPIKEETVVNYNDHINKLIATWIAEGSKNNFIEFLNTLPSRKSRFKFPEEQQPVKSFMLVPWIKDKLNLLKSKDTKYISDDLKLLTDLTKYLAKVDTVVRFDRDSHRAVMDVIRAAENGNITAVQTLAMKVNGFKIVDWILDNGKINYKLELIPFKAESYRSIPLKSTLIRQLEQYTPKLNKSSGVWEWPNMPTELPRVAEAGKLHAVTSLKFEGKQGLFVGKLKGEEWLSHQQKEFTKLTTDIEKKLNVKLTNKLSEDPVDYKGTIPDPDWTATLKGEWRITEYQKGKGKYNKVVTKVKVDPVPKDTMATETRTSKIIEIEDLKNVVFENKKVEAVKQDLLDPDAQLLAIEQKRIEKNVSEGGDVTITSTRTRKKITNEELDIVKKRIKKLEEMAETALQTVSYVDKVAEHITGRFGLSKYEVLADLQLKDGTPKYKDISDKYLDYSSWVIPPRLMKAHPFIRYLAQRVGDHMNKIDRELETFLFSPVARTLKLGEFDKESKGGVFSTGKVNIGATLLSRREYVRTKAGMVSQIVDLATSKEIVNGKKGWERADEMIQVAFKLQRDKSALAEKENLPYDLKNKDGTFRYEVTDLELKNTYKLDAEQISAYRTLRSRLNEGVNVYNGQAIKYSQLEGNNASEVAINAIPNYIPSMFFGDARIFVNKKGEVGKAQNGEIEWKDLEILEAIGKDNLISAQIYVRSNKEFKEKYPNANIYFKIEGKENNRILTKDRGGKYDVTIFMKDREKTKGTSPYEATSQFSEAILYLTRVGKKAQAESLKQARKEILATRGFPIHKLKKFGVHGAMGERVGKKANYKDVDNFVKAMQAYTEGLLRTAHGFEFRNDTAGRNGILNSKQMESYGNVKNLSLRIIENATGKTTGKFEKKANKVLRKYFGEKGLDKFFGAGNVFGLSTSLLFFNIRFLQSQFIQPYQMMIPKLRSLIRQKKLFSNNPNGEGLLLDGVLRSQKRMYRPEKEDFELIDFLHSQGVLEAKFFQEFLGKDAMSTTGKGVWNFASKLTMKSFVGRAESWSRLQAAMMVYHTLRLSGRSKKFSQMEAAHIADVYMVQYALHDRALIFGSAGMGVWGKPLGLFKTFQFNYLSQITEHALFAVKGIKKAVKKEQSWKDALKDAESTVYFVTSMVVTAGLYGVIAKEQADSLLRVLGYPTLTETLAESDLPNYLLWGIPSAVQGIDLTTTLSAPGLGAGDFFSAVSLDKLGLNPLKSPILLGKGNKGLAQGVSDLVLKGAFGGRVTRWEMQNFWKSLTPNSFHGVIEGYYSAKDPTFDIRKWGELPIQSENKKYGVINRDIKGWIARLMSSRTLEEARLFKVGYAVTLLDKRLDKNIDTIVIQAADASLKYGSIPEWSFEEAKKYNIRPEEFAKRVKSRIKLVTTTLMDRWKVKEITGRSLLKKDILSGVMNTKSKYKGNGVMLNINNITLSNPNFGKERVNTNTPSFGVPRN